MWQAQLFDLLNNHTYNQCEVDLFELMCSVIERSLFAQVDWARNSVFFRDLKVDDQMNLLQHSWSDILLLDHVHQRMHNNLADDMQLPNGQRFDLLTLALLGATNAADQLHALTMKLTELKFDTIDYTCLKFLLLLNPDAGGLNDYELVSEAYNQIQRTLLEFCVNFYSHIPDKFNRLMGVLPDLRAIAVRGEDFLYFKHRAGLAPSKTLLMEMLHAKRRA